MIMKNFNTCFFEIIVMLIFLQHHLVASLSPLQQKTALFQFKQSLTITTPTNSLSKHYSEYEYINMFSHPKTLNWSMSSDYCTWEGVSCQHKTGNVMGLDLSCSRLEGAILPNSTLFQLSHLQFLNLSENDFSLSQQFPQEFGFFAKGLTHLNLSFTQFSGRVPSGISHLYKLVSLDLSYNSYFKLEDEVFKSLLQNLNQLRVLNLQFLNIYSVLPINLSTSLRVLNLASTGLYGVLPQEVFHLPNLKLLDLSFNENLTGILAKVKWRSSGTLQHLFLDFVNFHHGGIPDSIGFLDSLATLSLSICNLSGPIPKSVGNLGQLTYLDLSGNNFNGPILTLLTNLTNLLSLDLRSNNFTGPLPSGLFNLPSLEKLDLSNNGFNGPLPSGLFNLSSLEKLYVSNNGLTGPLPAGLFDLDLSSLKKLYVTNNGFSGPLPPGLFDLPSLEKLYVSNNGFTGQLYEFDYSKSQMQYFSCRNNSLYGHIPQSFSQLVNLEYLDFSSNQIEGEIPHCIGSKGWNSLYYMNISHNRLTGGLEQLLWNNIEFLDLESNMLNGSLPTLICSWSSLVILNLSHNNLSGVLPSCRTKLTRLLVFDLRMNSFQGNIPANLSNFHHLETINFNGNKLEGRIPSSFAKFEYLKVLDLGNNQINDTFPQCLEALPDLQVLILKSNMFYGLMNKSSKIEHPFPRLRIIDLSYNEFSGPLPAMYFQNFKAMMIGDVNKGNVTYMGGRFDGIAYYSDSTILVIKGVEIKFVRILNVLTTIDVSKNNFEGDVLESIADLVSLRYLNLSHNHLTGHIPSSIGNLSMLESLDLSSNQFEGEIPRQLTSIYSLARLYMSCNQLTGHIPEGSQFNTFENDIYLGNLELCGHPLSKKCEIKSRTQEEDDEDDDHFFSGFTWKAVVIGYGCGVVPAFVAGYLMLLAGKPKWFAGIIARELGLKIRRMEIKWR